MNTYETYTIPSSNKISNLAVKELNNVKNPIAVVQIVHGMREHIARYMDFAMYLNSHGIIVAGHDHLGHGDTVDSPEDYGFFGEKNGALYLLRDTTKMTVHLHKKYSDLPLFVLGHSMGSFITRLSVLNTADIINGFICMGTGGCPAGTSLAKVLVESMSFFRGADGQTDFTDYLMENYSLRRLKGSSSPSEWISRDTETVAKYDADPKTNFSFTNKGYGDLFDLQTACNQPEWFEKYNHNLSTIVLSGDQDPIGGFGVDPPLIARKLKANGVKDITFKLYPLARHELLNEINREEVYVDILSWINKHI